MSEIIPVPPVAPPAPTPPPTPPPAPPAPPPPPSPPAADWREDWRTAMAVVPEDAKVLERFSDPKALWTSYSALTKKVSSGELRSVTPFPAAGTPEAQAEWRKQAGVPEAPDKYDLTGLTIDEAEKPIVDAYLKAAHEIHLGPEQTKALLTARAKIVADQQAKQAEAYTRLKTETADKLNAEMGADYRRNMNLISGMLDAHMEADPDLKTNVLRAVETNAGYARFMAALALQINPTATIFAAGTDGAPGDLDARIAEITKMMKADPKAYRDPKISGPDGEFPKLLARYQQVNGKAYGT